MILLSPGGQSIQHAASPSETLLVATTDGVCRLSRSADGWTQRQLALQGCFVSALTRLADGAVIAATRGVGLARSDDGGQSWTWINAGLTHFDVWSVRAGIIGGRELIFAGTMPAHLFVSDDGGAGWRECPALRRVPSVAKWTFPPQPRLGHVKDIVIAGGRLLVGIEIGALLVSDDAGLTFRELPVDADPQEVDIHRILVHSARPERLIIANGLLGIMHSADGGRTWTRGPNPPDMHYPDALVMHPGDADLLFVAAATGWPPHWYRLGRGRGKIARSRDGGRSWERLLGGLPDGQRAVFSAMTLEAWEAGFRLYAGDTDGQIFESVDGGERWSIIADLPPLSKGDFHRALARGRPPLADLDDMAFNEAAGARLNSLKL